MVSYMPSQAPPAVVARPLLTSPEHAEEQIRSAQLYASSAEDMFAAAELLSQEHGIDHLDINFGCPVRKITSRGGGAAIPLKRALLQSLVRAAVAGAGDVPVTVKMRLGINPDLVRGSKHMRSSG
jgi:tRNA-dihydrouridine synthase